jgi:uncharacterized membrane protein YdjX (TVP38/TMEM64 family)
VEIKSRQPKDTPVTETITKEAPQKKIPYKLIGGVVVIIALFAMWRILPLEQWLTQFNHWVSDLGTSGMIVYGLFYIIATVLFVPGAITTIGSGFLFGLWWGTLVVNISATIGAACAFLIARYFARDWVRAKAEQNAKFNAIDKAIGKQGGKIIGLLRLSPALPFSLSNYLYGLTAVKFWPYVVATWLGTLPGTVMFVYLGAIGKAGLSVATDGTTTSSPAQQAFLIIGLLATVAVTIIITRIAQKALKNTEIAS